LKNSASYKSTEGFSVPEMIRVLSHHYGDGTIYLPSEKQRSIYDIAVERGLINEEGYLTRKGRIFLARHLEPSD